MKSQDEQKQIAGEILRQLGGNKFIAMTGAKNLVYSENEKGNTILTFKIGQNSKRINYIRIEYVGGIDLYNIEFINYRMGKNYDVNLKQIAHHEQIYNDMLVPIFEQETGMYTKLI
jgi:hypothetical protein